MFLNPIALINGDMQNSAAPDMDKPLTTALNKAKDQSVRNAEQQLA